MRILERSPGPWALAVAVALAFPGGSRASLEKAIRVPADHPTIQKGMDAAAAGDTVLVAPGTYTENVAVRDGVVLMSEKGASETTIAYDTSVKSENEAVISLQQSTNSTEVIGFSIDGKGVAKRGILAIGDGEPVIAECRIVGAANGIGSHRNSAPYILDTKIEQAQVAGIFVQSGSADIRHCDLSGSANYGLVIEGTTRPARVVDCRIHDNVQAGVRATDGDFTITGGSISGNGNTGLILEYVAPMIQGVRIEGNKNIGVALQNSTGTLLECTIRNNNFGVAISGTGDPKIFRCTFEDNTTYHIGVEGDVVPLIGGTLPNANLFLGASGAVIQTACAMPVNMAYNYWGRPCSTKEQVKRLAGAKDVIRKPWVAADLKHFFYSCDEARKQSRTPVTGDEEAAPTTPQTEAAGQPGAAPESTGKTPSKTSTPAAG
ncbi:MAG: right-handed parallel beta-helix repeat-containing protein [bacterium]